MRTLITCLAVLGTATLARAQTPCPSVGPDVVLGDLTAIGNYPPSGGIEALIFGTSTCNVGDQEVSVDAGTNQHYVVSQNLYRLQDRGGWFAFEQVGMSWLRHSFFALSQVLCCPTCTPPAVPGTSLGVGCADPLSTSTNGSQPLLAPRWEVDAFTGAFAFPPSNPSFSGSSARRIEVLETDLEPTASTTTRYFGEVQLVAPDDALAGNGGNNASYRELGVVDTGPEFVFGPFLGTTQRERPALLAWQDVDPAVLVEEIDVPGEGRLLLASRVTALDDCLWHYEYALYNATSDDSIRSFELPFGEGTVLSGLGFHDVAYRNGDGAGDVDRDGTDWTALQGTDFVRWEVVGHHAPPADVNHNALRWGTTYNFRFDADAPPQMGMLTLTTYKTETAFGVSGVPTPAGGSLGAEFCSDADGSLAACPCTNPGLPDTGCDLQQGTGGVRLAAVRQETDPPNRATFLGSGFPVASTPTSIVIRAPALDPVAPVVFGDGLRCVGVPLVRLAATFAAGGAALHTFGHGAMAGTGTFYYQLWFRNTPAMYCTPDAFNLSNGHTLAWGGAPAAVEEAVVFDPSIDFMELVEPGAGETLEVAVFLGGCTEPHTIVWSTSDPSVVPMPGTTSLPLGSQGAILPLTLTPTIQTDTEFELRGTISGPELNGTVRKQARISRTTSSDSCHLVRESHEQGDPPGPMRAGRSDTVTIDEGRWSVVKNVNGHLTVVVVFRGRAWITTYSCNDSWDCDLMTGGTQGCSGSTAVANGTGTMTCSCP